jgi:hypothetical protein
MIRKDKKEVVKMFRSFSAKQRGVALLLALLIVLVLLGLGGVFLLISQTAIQRAALDEGYVSALSIAEAGAERAIWKIKNEWINHNRVWTEGFGCEKNPKQIKDGKIVIGSYYVTIEDLGTSLGVSGQQTQKLKITSVGRKGKREQLIIGSVVRGIEVIVELVPGGERLADVFDYAYFLNNWGWWGWGGNSPGDDFIREWVRGDMRSNGRFDFWPVWDKPLAPRVDGHVWANFEIDENFDDWPRHSHLRGAAGTCDEHEEGEIVYPEDEHSGLVFQHPDAGKGDMPNLQNPQYYRDLANGTLQAFLPGTITINGVFGDDEEHRNVVIFGDEERPIRLNGPVYIERDVIIKGYVTGQGTIYAGRNVYIAGNIIYSNPPVDENGNPCYYPETENENGVPSDEEIQAWYDRNVNADILAIAARESIIVGDYPDNRWSDGDPYWWPAWYGLFDMGSEDVGKDGIPDTGDEGEGDGIFGDPNNPNTPAWEENYEDLDGDGIFDQVHMHQQGQNYNWRDVTTTGLPSQQSDWIDGTAPSEDYANRGNARRYRELCDFGGISRLDGIFYTQHFLAGTFIDMPGPWQFPGTPIIVNGSLISKDECMVYWPMFNWNYDWRIHQRYRADPNWPIDLDLPPATGGGAGIYIISWKEVDV